MQLLPSTSQASPAHCCNSHWRLRSATLPVPTQPIRLLIPQGSRGENIEQTVKDFMAYASNIFLLQTGYQVCAALWLAHRTISVRAPSSLQRHAG